MDTIAGWEGNCYVYFNTASGKFVFIPWDNNEAFGSTSEGLSLDELLSLDIHNPVVHPEDPCPLIGRTLDVPEYAAEYEGRLRALVDGQFSVAGMNKAIASTYGMIRESVYRDTRRDYSITEFDMSIYNDVPGRPKPPYSESNMVIGLKRFVAERVASVESQLAQ